jgi:hypothetical protein
MAGRLTRFLNLEKPHVPGEKPPAPHEVATRARFTGEPSGIALEPDFGEQPFLRCPNCEADNTRYAERCMNCRAPMGGDDVRAFNERLWAERQAQRARDDAALRESRAQPDLVQQNRMLGEALAREVGERERARMSWWWGGGYQDATPIGLRLLSLLPTTQGRVIAGGLAFVTFVGAVGLALSARGHPRLQGVGFVVGLLLLVLFTPNVPRRRRWWW